MYRDHSFMVFALGQFLLFFCLSLLPVNFVFSAPNCGDLFSNNILADEILLRLQDSRGNIRNQALLTKSKKTFIIKSGDLIRFTFLNNEVREVVVRVGQDVANGSGQESRVRGFVFIPDINSQGMVIETFLNRDFLRHVEKVEHLGSAPVLNRKDSGAFPSAKQGKPLTRAYFAKGWLKVREHRGSLQESLNTEVEIVPTVEVLAAHISQVWDQKIHASEIAVSHYGFDKRIGWDTFLISVENQGVFGFTNGPVVGLHYPMHRNPFIEEEGY